MPWTLIILAALTVFAGVLRFAWIDRPTLWNDEAHTFRRVTGSFQELLNILQSDGFAPLHYEMYWALGHWHWPGWGRFFGGLFAFDLGYDDFFSGNPATLAPFWMRLIPALAGTLMVPAMYFLARQFTTRRNSLVIAAFVACSAWLMVFSHDAKMYMHFWLFLVLHVGSLLWWLRTRQRVAWLAWIAAGLAMGGTHAPGLILLAIEPIFVITSTRQDRKKYVLFVLGLFVIGSGPAVHYHFFNRWVHNIESEGWDARSGLPWLRAVVQGRSGPERVLYTASAFLYSWEWPRFSYSDDDPSNLRDRNTPRAFSKMLQGFNIVPAVFSGLASAVVLILALAGFGAMPWRTRQPANPPQPWWRMALWLGVWIVVPTYGFYCASIDGFAGPGQWLSAANSYLASLFPTFIGAAWPIAAIVLIAAIATGMRSHRYTPRIAAGVAIGIVFIAVVIILIRGGVFSTWPAERWRLTRTIGWGAASILTDGRFMLPLLLIASALAWHTCAPTHRHRLLRVGQLLIVIALPLLLCWAMYAWFIAHPPKNDGPIWMPRYIGIVWPAFAIAMCVLLMRLPRPVNWLAIALLLSVNLSQAYGRMFWGSEPPVDRIVADAWAANSPMSAMRTYIEAGPETAHPAGGVIENRPGKYYLCVARGQSFAPAQFLSFDVNRVVKIRRETSPQAIAADLTNAPHVQQFVVWQRFPDLQTAQTTPPLSIEGWRLIDAQVYPVRYHWNWSTCYALRRINLARTGE